jgi:hypothetical protein
MASKLCVADHQLSDELELAAFGPFGRPAIRPTDSIVDRIAQRVETN